MSCNRQNKAVSGAAGRNGVWGVANNYLGALGSWATWQGLQEPGEIPLRLEQVTRAYLGLSGLAPAMRAGDKRWQVGGSLLGAVLALHAAEQLSGAAATAAMRTWRRGQAAAKYRGIVIRRSPGLRQEAKLLNRLSGGRLLAATGYHFNDRGRTWSARSFTFQLHGAPRTFTRLSSLGIPNREYFFDRPPALEKEEAAVTGADGEVRGVYLQRLIDVIKGDEAAADIPGYIGSVNELESAVAPLGAAKRTLALANWLLLDESERDDPASNTDVVDYDALLRGVTKRDVAQEEYYRVREKTPAWRWTAPPANPYTGLAARAVPPKPPPPRAAPEPGVSRAGQMPDPAKIKNRWRGPDGKLHPILIETVVTHPITRVRKAKNAYYHDGGQWRQIVDERELAALGAAYDRGEQTTIDEGGAL